MKDADLDAVLKGSVPAPPPPLSDQLEAELARMEPVATRRPWRDVARVAGASLVYAAALTAILKLRRDLPTVPVWWMIAIGAAWFAGFFGLVTLALVPRRGSMLPRWRVVGIGAIAVGLACVVGGLLMHPMSPDSTQYDLSTVHKGHWCLEIGLATAIVPVALGALALRGAMVAGGRWTAAGLGAAGGALGGLVLHMHCPIADHWHMGLVHGGMVCVAAALAALIVPGRAT